ncbi:alcohol dehydrogenase catalytic domain-containing protein [uncultured Sphaerochaeta sp.]|uniref:zinc-dependent alcohol dehydrogenase n=1 Tax=uncultured Sphaerochaeta sp. TaxID=886478 RepID=UPI002A0A128A|nr:alcohol dehydrogenase catalytic domain-containing protein [uncultured Sphaerochaeta sp.]
MKCASITSPRHVELSDIRYPSLKPSQIMVKIAYCGICTLEQRLFTGSRRICYPIVPGHEASGEIVEIGSEVLTDHRVHDRVVLDLVTRCHGCLSCRTGNTNLCENRHKIGSQLLGAFCEYVAVQPEQVFTIAPSFSLLEATFAEPLACCLRSLAKIDASLGKTLLIIGCGTMGMLHAKAALSMGLRVLVSDINKTRLSQATSMGVDAAFDASNPEKCIKEILDFTQGYGVEGCIITSSSQIASAMAFQVLCPGSKVNIFTSYDDTPIFPVDMNTVHRKEIQITGSEGRSELDFSLAVKALSYGKVQVKDLISDIFPLQDVAKALEAALQETTYRVLIKVGDQ